jgi:hypothetical protein
VFYETIENKHGLKHDPFKAICRTRGQSAGYRPSAATVSATLVPTASSTRSARSRTT